jgi:hypothetical protein
VKKIPAPLLIGAALLAVFLIGRSAGAATAPLPTDSGGDSTVPMTSGGATDTGAAYGGSSQGAPDIQSQIVSTLSETGFPPGGAIGIQRGPAPTPIPGKPTPSGTVGYAGRA